jgi:cysteine desulfurase
MLYLDHAATTPVLPEALQAAWPYLTNEFGNPSSAHEPGLRAANALDWARQTCADLLGCKKTEVVFTSGGTESNNLAIKGIALANPRGKHIISARTEHNAVLQCLDYLEHHHGFEVSYLALNQNGIVDPETLSEVIRPDTTLITLMLANNETGAIHPIGELARIAATHRVPFHTDAVQAAGWFDLNVSNLGVDALSLSGHKFGAPKGSGLLYLRNRFNPEPVLHGGGQEFGRRSGTQNVAWAVAIATALQNLSPAANPQVSNMVRSAQCHAATQAFINAVLERFPHARLSGPAQGELRHPAIAAFTFEGVNGETLLLELERNGVIVSSGSACAAGSQEPSHVLQALGIHHDLCQTAVRFSFGHSASTHQASQAHAALTAAMSAITGENY